MPTKLKRITVNLPDRIGEVIEERARQANRSVANYVLDLIDKNIGTEGKIEETQGKFGGSAGAQKAIQAARAKVEREHKDQARKG